MQRDWYNYSSTYYKIINIYFKLLKQVVKLVRQNSCLNKRYSEFCYTNLSLYECIYKVVFYVYKCVMDYIERKMNST